MEGGNIETHDYSWEKYLFCLERFLLATYIFWHIFDKIVLMFLEYVFMFGKWKKLKITKNKLKNN